MLVSSPPDPSTMMPWFSRLPQRSLSPVTDPEEDLDLELTLYERQADHIHHHHHHHPAAAAAAGHQTFRSRYPCYKKVPAAQAQHGGPPAVPRRLPRQSLAQQQSQQQQQHHCTMPHLYPLPIPRMSTTSSSNSSISSCDELYLPLDPRLWMREDVQLWIRFMSYEHGLPSVESDRFLMNGKALCLMNMDMFCQRVPLGGKMLFKDFQLRLALAMNRC